MAVSHVFSNAGVDFTGTITGFNSQGSTTTIAATNLVRPSDWNSAHNQYFTLTGNTNNASTVSGSNIILSGGSNITLVGNGASIGISANGPQTVSYFDNLIAGHAAAATVALSSRVSQQNTVWLWPISPDGFPGEMTVSSVLFNCFNSGNTNSISAALSYSWGFGVYEVTNGSQLTLVAKARSTYSQSANAGYSGTWAGQRWLSIHGSLFSNSANAATSLQLQANRSYIGALSISSAGSAVQTHNFLGIYRYSTAVRSGYMGAASDANNTTKGFHPWVGQLSMTSTNFPNSAAMNNVNRQVASGNFIPHMVFNNIGAV